MAEVSVLQRGDTVPHFEVKTVTGEVFSYATVWQRRNLLLVVVPGSSSDDSYAAALRTRDDDVRNRETNCVITREEVAGLPGPAVLIADRWGEIVHIATAPAANDLPTPEDLLEWLDYLSRRCPECEGEAR